MSSSQQQPLPIRDQILFLTIGLISLIVLYLMIGPNRILPGDEMRFIETSKSFANNFGLTLLKHYEEMSTPLPFMVFGLWGEIFSFELWSMRIGAMLIALCTLHQLCLLCNACLQTRKQAWLVGLSLCFANPYFLPMGTMVYTDMLALFFLLMALRSYFCSNTIGMVIGCM
ncbi:MAG: hypothetical protein JKX85_11785 [Phycisphaeraceae bacterium]|nr:hypothetical protein [Phycisphaeraceae bacterium]